MAGKLGAMGNWNRRGGDVGRQISHSYGEWPTLALISFGVDSEAVKYVRHQKNILRINVHEDSVRP